MKSEPRLGQINRLKILDKVADGFLLDGEKFGQLLLPAFGSIYARTGELVEVFLYTDADARVCATVEMPKAAVGECAALRVKTVGRYGAFLDWGIDKDLLLPHSEQSGDVSVGDRVVVYVALDNRSGRIFASTRLHKYLEESSGPYKTGDQVELLIAAKTEIGYKAIFNGAYLGLIFHSDLSQPLRIGEHMTGWIKFVRDDGKVDLSINTLDAGARDELEQRILDTLAESGGRLDLSDKSDPEVIFKKFRVSKKNYKRALSGLYKAQLIRIYPEYVELTGS